MMDMYKMCDVIEEEISKIAEKGLNTSNLETAYKLIDMYKDLKTIEGMDKYEEGNSYAMDGNYANMRHSRNGYSRENDSYGRYSQAKYDYRHSRSNGDLRTIMSTLDEYMSDMSDRLNDMLRDADTQEEKDTIRRYISKIKMA